MIKPRTPDSEENLDSADQKSRSDVAPKGAQHPSGPMRSAPFKPQTRSGMRPAVQLPTPPNPPKPTLPTQPELDLELTDEEWDEDSAAATLVDAAAVEAANGMPSPLGDDEDDDPPTRETPRALSAALRAVAELPVPGGELPQPAEELGPVPLVPPPPRMPSAVSGALPAQDPLLPRYASPDARVAKQSFDSHIRPSPPRGHGASPLGSEPRLPRPTPPPPRTALTPSGAFPTAPQPRAPSPRPLLPPPKPATPSGAFAPEHTIPSRSGVNVAAPPASQPSSQPSIQSVPSLPSHPSSMAVRNVESTFIRSQHDASARPFPSDTLRRTLLAYRPEMPPRDWLYIIVPMAIAVGIAIGLAIVFFRLASQG
jgi:hypothetical protein